MKKDTYFSNWRICFLDDPKQVAAYLWQHEKEEAEIIIATAEEIVQQSFLFNQRWDMERTSEPVVFPHDIDWLYQPSDDSEWVYAFNRMRFWITLGQAYALTSNEQYAEAFASQLCHWVKNVRRSDPKSQKAWRSIEAGLRMEYWIKAMQYFKESPSITESVLETFLSSIADHAEFLYSVWDSYHLMSNWGVLENHGLFLASLALQKSEISETYCKEAIRRLAREIEIQVYDDGMQWEQSPMYHNEVLHCYLDVVILARRLHIPLPEVIKEKTYKMCKASLAWQKPDGTEPCMGDSDAIDQRDLITKAAYFYQDGELKKGGYLHLNFDTIWDLGFRAVKCYDQLPSLPTSQCLFVLHESGNAIYKEEGTYLRFHCGTLGAGHGHSDKLHFDLYANGEDLLVDAGRYTYVPKSERYEFKDSSAHNTTTVDNKNFTVCKDSWECSKLSAPIGFRTAQKNGYIAFQGSHQGYLDVGVLPRRTIVVLEKTLILICDEFLSQEHHRYQSYLHFNDKGKVRLQEPGAVYQSAQNAMHIHTLSSGGVTQYLKSTRLSRHYNELFDNKTLVSEVESDGFASLFTLVSINEDAVFKKERVLSNFKKIRFPDSLIEAVTIKKGDDAYTIVLSHQEWASPTDTFNADGCTGFGSLVVFDRGKGETEIGARLFT
ncbi:MAG: alginate lyase family protein [Sphaerochaetaceae bacterium]|nr:alginate lyase family protein [Sphaerochaetaceae bacterium]